MHFILFYFTNGIALYSVRLIHLDHFIKSWHTWILIMVTMMLIAVTLVFILLNIIILSYFTREKSTIYFSFAWGPKTLMFFIPNVPSPSPTSRGPCPWYNNCTAGVGYPFPYCFLFFFTVFNSDKFRQSNAWGFCVPSNCKWTKSIKLMMILNLIGKYYY